MYYLVYASAASEPLSRGDLVDLLHRSRQANQRLGVTGLLLYRDGNFLQVLEGERAVVRDLFTRIAHDPRHRQVMRLLEGETDERQYGDWAMAFTDLEGPGLPRADGYSEFLNTPFTGAELAACPSKAQRLLVEFKRAMQSRNGLW